MNAKLQFEDLSFEHWHGGVRAKLLKSFYFDIESKSLEEIGPYEFDEHSITFSEVSESKAKQKFTFLLEKHFPLLRNIYTKKPAIYIHRNSGIPLIGCQSFGLIDRNTSIIEVRPVTGCNLNCVYCSVDEGLSTSKILDFIVEKDYLVQEFKKLVDLKNCSRIEAHIGTQGDPTLYGPLVELVRDLRSVSQVKEVVMDTNGMLLTEKIIDDLAEAGMTRINLSINAMDPLLAKKIAGYGKYDVEHAKKIAAYAAKKMTLLIAPVLVGAMNKEEIRKIVLFAKEIGAKVGIQNFLNYKHGRNPVKQMAWEDFYAFLKQLEEETGMKLLLTKEDFKITYTQKLPKPFKKGEAIEAEIICSGRLPGETLCKAQERCIIVSDNKKKEGKIMVRIDRSKHNIFRGHAI
ncbi:MAG: radical SAM protein [Nanoarchaeota archaeon]